MGIPPSIADANATTRLAIRKYLNEWTTYSDAGVRELLQLLLVLLLLLLLAVSTDHSPSHASPQCQPPGELHWQSWSTMVDHWLFSGGGARVARPRARLGSKPSKRTEG